MAGLPPEMIERIKAGPGPEALPAAMAKREQASAAWTKAQETLRAAIHQAIETEIEYLMESDRVAKIEGREAVFGDRILKLMQNLQNVYYYASLPNDVSSLRRKFFGR